MMALNIAVPMSGVGDLLEGFGLLSPISPVSIDFRSSMKNPLSPVGSESSGVSSLDLEDIKKQMPTLLDENEDVASGPGDTPSNLASLSGATTMSTTSSRTCSTSSSSSSSDDYTNQLDENEPKLSETPTENGATASVSPSAELLGSSEKVSNEPTTTTIDDADALLPHELLSSLKEPSGLPLFSPKTVKEPIFTLPRQSIMYNNRDIVDLGSNLRPQGSAPGEFAFQFAELPATNNIQFFLQNRSQYHRIGPNGHVQEFRMETCPCCDFQYPVNAVGAANSAATPINQTFGTSNLCNLTANQIYGNLQQQQQQQQLRLQQQQLQMQYAYRLNNNNGNSVTRDYNLYQQTASGIGGGNGNAGGGGLQSSRFTNGVYGSGNVPGGSLSNAQNGIAGSSAISGGIFNTNALGNNLLGRDQFNHVATMGTQYNNTSAILKGISQMNGTSSQSSGLRQQQQYDMQKQYAYNYSQRYVTTNSIAMPASANAAVRLQQQQQQQQQSSHYYKKTASAVRYGVGPTGANNIPSGGPTGFNWKNTMTPNIAIQESTTTKLFMELNKMQQQSPYPYVPFQ